MSTIKTNSVILGQSATDTNNFLLDTDTAGALRIHRRSDGSGGLVMSINSSGIPLDKDGFDMRPLGVGQTWQDMTGSRALATSYVNNTGRTIQIQYHGTNSNVNGCVAFNVGGVQYGLSSGSSAVGGVTSGAFAVPPGATYSITNFLTTNTIVKWSELRT